MDFDGRPLSDPSRGRTWTGTAELTSELRAECDALYSADPQTLDSATVHELVRNVLVAGQTTSEAE